MCVCCSLCGKFTWRYVSCYYAISFFYVNFYLKKKKKIPLTVCTMMSTTNFSSSAKTTFAYFRCSSVTLQYDEAVLYLWECRACNLNVVAKCEASHKNMCRTVRSSVCAMCKFKSTNAGVNGFCTYSPRYRPWRTVKKRENEREMESVRITVNRHKIQNATHLYYKIFVIYFVEIVKTAHTHFLHLTKSGNYFKLLVPQTGSRTNNASHICVYLHVVEYIIPLGNSLLNWFWFLAGTCA